MKTNPKFKKLTIAGIILLILGPVLAWLFAVPLGKQFCNPQIIAGTDVCLANYPIFAALLFGVPVITGLILLIVASLTMVKR